ncbi:hypothetical protein [Aquamicrobium soli]|uniref:Uncharacterized protein n=1 Tax=Aquamicrobium soli TaxID=1811518 RepID=A0ABV7KBG2_9HYPH
MPAVISAARVADHINSDGVHRAMRSALSYTVPPGRARDDALEGYFDKPQPANDERRVYRKTHSRDGYSGYCSTAFRDVYISLPRVGMVDGPFPEAANDNASHEVRHAQEGYHAAA